MIYFTFVHFASKNVVFFIEDTTPPYENKNDKNESPKRKNSTYKNATFPEQVGYYSYAQFKTF